MIFQRGRAKNHQPDIGLDIATVRIDGQADFPITNLRVAKPMDFVPWDAEKNEKTPLWTGASDHFFFGGPWDFLSSLQWMCRMEKP